MDVSQYLDIFLDESKEHLQSLSDQLMILEQEPDHMDTINEIFRAAHSLKGMAGTMGYKRMQTLTHDMENVFSEVRNGAIKIQSDMIDTLFKCLDALEEYLVDSFCDGTLSLSEDDLGVIEGDKAAGVDDLGLHAVVDLGADLALQAVSHPSALADLLETLEVTANVRAAPRFLAREIKRHPTCGITHHTQQLLFGEMLVAAKALAHRDLFRFFLHFLIPLWHYSALISIL